MVSDDGDCFPRPLQDFMFFEAPAQQNNQNRRRRRR